MHTKLFETMSTAMAAERSPLSNSLSFLGPYLYEFPPYPPDLFFRRVTFHAPYDFFPRASLTISPPTHTTSILLHYSSIFFSSTFFSHLPPKP